MSLRAIISVVVFLLLCAWAGWSGGRVAQRYDFERDARNDRQTRVDLVRLGMSGALPPKSVLEESDHLAAHLALPRAPLAGMAVGVAPVYPSAYRPTLDSLSRAFDPEPLESGHFLRDWHLDIATVLLVALPVLILFGPGLTPLLAIAAGLVGSLVGFFASAPEFGAGGVWVRLILWLLVTTVYGWFWSMLRTWLDKIKGGEAFAIALYALLVFVLPGLGALVARTITPVPSGAEVLAEVRRAASGIEQRDAQTLIRFHMGHPNTVDGENSAEYDQLKLKSIGEWEKVSAGPLASYQSGIDRHRFGANLLRIFSPAAAAQGALLETAGTGSGRYASFAEQADDFTRTKWAPFFLQRAGQGQRLAQTDLDRLPKFKYEEPSVIMTFLTVLLFVLPIAFAGVLVSRK